MPAFCRVSVERAGSKAAKTGSFGDLLSPPPQDTGATLEDTVAIASAAAVPSPLRDEPKWPWIGGDLVLGYERSFSRPPLELDDSRPLIL